MVSVSLRTKDFKRRSQMFRFPGFTCNKEVLFAKLKELFEYSYRGGELYRTTGVGFGEISYQLQKYGLFDQKDERQEKMQEIASAINKKYGKTLITSATNARALSGKKPEIGLILGKTS